MIFNLKKQNGIWFAWFPVIEKSEKFMWLEYVQRTWNEQKYFVVIDPYDPGDYEAGWDYSIINK